jgi:hypothetical protein
VNAPAGGIRRRARPLKPKLGLFAQQAKRHRIRIKIIHRARKTLGTAYGSANRLKNKAYHG